MIVIAHHPTAPRLYPTQQFAEYSRTRLREIYKSYRPQDHYRDWTDAILASEQASSHFDVAAPLAQTVLLGTIAQRLPGEALKWNDQAMRFTANPKADSMVRRPYRKGWGIDLLAG